MPKPKSDLTEHIEPTNFPDSHDIIEPISESDHDVESAMESQIPQVESAEMVKLPDCFYNDVFKESKTNRMLESFMDFEQTKRYCQNEIGDVPDLEQTMKIGITNFDKRPPRPWRDLEKDLEACLDSKTDDFLAMKKIDISRLTFEAKEILSSDTPILAPQEQQIQYCENLMQNKGTVEVESLLHHDIDIIDTQDDDSRAPPQSQKVKDSGPKFLVEDEIAQYVDSDINADELTTKFDASVSLKVNLDHDYYLKRPVVDHDLTEAPDAKKIRDSDQGHCVSKLLSFSPFS